MNNHTEHNKQANGDIDGDAVTRCNRLLAVPNVLCAIRLLGSPFLIVLAILGRPMAFVGLYLFLAMTDWVDGKLAILLDQRSTFGARLDSWADAALYGGLLLGGLWLQWETLSEYGWWIGIAFASYVATTSLGFWKYGRWPSYHTRAAKTSWFLVTVGAVCLLLGWATWPFKLAMVSVTITNIEAILITLTLPRWAADVRSIIDARRIAAGATPDEELAS